MSTPPMPAPMSARPAARTNGPAAANVGLPIAAHSMSNGVVTGPPTIECRSQRQLHQGKHHRTHRS